MNEFVLPTDDLFEGGWPLISHIEGNLYQGGCIENLNIGNLFKHIISLDTYGASYVSDSANFFLIKGVIDGIIPPSHEDIISWVKTLDEFIKDGPTLVHCQAGINRSGLLCAAYLIYKGRTPQEAIDFIREKRTGSLENKYFVQHLLDLKFPEEQ